MTPAPCAIRACCDAAPCLLTYIPAACVCCGGVMWLGREGGVLCLAPHMALSLGGGYDAGGPLPPPPPAFVPIRPL